MSNIRQLQKRVTFQKPAAGADSEGWPNSGYTDYATVWAQLVGGTTTRITGKELVGAETVLSENDLLVTIRFRADITSDMRMMYNGVPYAIVALVDKDGMRVWLDLLVKGWQSGGI